MTKAGLETFKRELVGLSYLPAFESAPKRFRTSTNVPLEIRLEGEYPGDGLPKPVRFSDPKDVFVGIEGIKTISLEKLVDLKLASGISAPHRLKNLADVQEIIKIKKLSADFAGKLDPSVREKFKELQATTEFSEDF